MVTAKCSANRISSHGHSIVINGTVSCALMHHGQREASTMTTVLVLLLGSAVVGLVIGRRYKVWMLAASAPILALVGATAARLSDFGLLAGVAITFACLTVSQVTYLLASWLSVIHAERLAYEPSDEKIRENGQSDVPDDQTQHDHAPTYLRR